MKTTAMLLLSLLLAGCATLPPHVAAPPPVPLFNDQLFAAPTQAIRAADVFALSPEMKRYVAEEIARSARLKTRQMGLLDALYTENELRLEYDTALTRNAAEAFAARSGNCLSLVIMTAAFAKEMGLPVSYQKVFVDEAWARDGDLFLSIGHVNLVLGRRRADQGWTGYRTNKRPPESEGLIVDFLPSSSARNLRSLVIGEDVIVAMYMNNRAVEAMARDQLDDAYAWVREAIVQAPTFLTPYNTLGAIYQRHGDLREAEQALNHVLTQDNKNALAMSNLARVYKRMGRDAESQALVARLNTIEPDAPFSQFNRGRAALAEGDTRTAIDVFKREVARAPDYHEFQFWLAVAYANDGQLELARTHLAQAMKNSTTRRDHEVYAAKLARIKDVQAN